MADAEVLADGVEDLVTAHDRAQGVRADPERVPAVGVPLVLGVEGRHGRHLGVGQRQHLRAEGNPVGGHEAVLGLHEVQQRQQS